MHDYQIYTNGGSEHHRAIVYICNSVSKIIYNISCQGKRNKGHAQIS